MKPVFAGSYAPPPPPDDADRARGRAVRQARMVRSRRLRRRVITAAVALFVAAWLMIAVILVTGHDPALAAHTSSPATTATATGATSTPAATSTGATTTSTTSGSSPATGSSASGTTSSTPATSTSTGSSSSSSGTTGVVTRQS